MKKWKNKLANSFEILFITGPDRADTYSGVVSSNGFEYECGWDLEGNPIGRRLGNTNLALVPLEPIVRYARIANASKNNSCFSYVSNASLESSYENQASNLKITFDPDTLEPIAVELIK